MLELVQSPGLYIKQGDLSGQPRDEPIRTGGATLPGPVCTRSVSKTLHFRCVVSQMERYG
jgi:hypothetical protein